MDIQEKLVDFEKKIDLKKKELLARQKDINAFVDTGHKAIATIEYQKEVRALASEINDLLIEMIDSKELAGALKPTAEKLCENGTNLNNIVRDISTALTNDLMQRQKDEDIDIIKIASLMATLTLTAVTVSRYTLDPDSSHAALEATFGATAGIGISFHKQLARKFKKAAGVLCLAPLKIKNSFTVYYLKETSKEMGARLLAPLRSETSFVLTTNGSFPARKMAKDQLKFD